MTYITQLTGRSSVYSYRCLTMIFAGCALLFLQSSVVQGQWSNGANINNTNNGTVSIGTTNPGGDKLIIAGNTVGGNVTTHTQLYSGYDSQANVIMELGYGTATANLIPYSTFVLSKNLTSANQLLGAFNFANRNIADGSDKRIAQIAAFTEATTNSGALAFLTMNAGAVNERMRISSTGNLGVGTSSPASNFHVATESTLTPRGITNSQHSADGIYRRCQLAADLEYAKCPNGLWNQWSRTNAH